LESELKYVLEDIGKPESLSLHLPKSKIFDKSRTTALFDTLRPLLESQSAESLDFVDELRTIPETAILVRQIEDIDFAAALDTMDLLREILDV